MSPQLARSEAQRLLTQGLSEQAWNVISVLAQCGVMSSEQLLLTAAPSTLKKKYKPRRIIDRLPFARAALQSAYQEHGLPFDQELQLYALGPVGVELAQLRFGTSPVTGYLAYPLERIMHDIIANEIVLRIRRFAFSRGWQTGISGTNNGALYSADYSHKILEPDVLLTLKKEGEESRQFCLEYHNEDFRTRAERKVDKYENVRLSNANIWQTTWETDAFPCVLAVFGKHIVGEGYRDKLKDNPSVGVQFYGKALEGVLQDNLAEWIHLNSGQRETIL